MFRQRRQFDVGKAEVAHVLRQQRGEFAVTEEAVALLGHAPPGAGVHLVDRHRRAERVGAAPAFHPGAVAPIVIKLPYAGGGTRRRLRAEGEGIALFHPEAVVARSDVVLVQRPRPDPGDEPGPDAGAVLPLAEGMGRPVPLVEVADHRDRCGVRCPHREARSLDPVRSKRVGPHLFIQSHMGAFTEQVTSWSVMSKSFAGGAARFFFISASLNGGAASAMGKRR